MVKVLLVVKVLVLVLVLVLEVVTVLSKEMEQRVQNWIQMIQITRKKKQRLKQRQEQRNHQYPNAALPCSDFGKSCAQCNSMKPRTSFSKNQLRKGDAARCTECVNATGGGGFGRGDGDSSSGSGWGWPAKRRRRGW